MFDPGGVLHAALFVLREGSGVPHSPPLGDLGGNKENHQHFSGLYNSIISVFLKAQAAPATGSRASALHILPKPRLGGNKGQAGRCL